MRPRFHRPDRRAPLAFAAPPPEAVTLVQLPLWGVKMPPLHLASLAALLNRAGVRTTVRDFNIEAFSALRRRSLGHLWGIGTAPRLPSLEAGRLLEQRLAPELDRLVQQLLASPARIIGFNLNVGNRYLVCRVVERLRRLDPRRWLLAGGPEVQALQAKGELARLPAHFLLPGEADEALLELCRRLLCGAGVVGVPGVLLGPGLCGAGGLDRAQAAYVPRPPPRDLDSLPFPSYDELDLSPYLLRKLPFVLSRGCTARCPFCADRQMQPTFRCRSPEHALAEVEHHVRRLRAPALILADLALNNDMRALCHLALAMIRRDLTPWWAGYAMVRREMTPSVLALLRRAGCTDLHYGVESGSDAVLRRMHKPYSAALAGRVLRDTHRAGIRPSLNIIVGYPGETEGEFRQTCALLRRHRDHIHQVLNLSPLTLLPGSAIARRPGDSPDAAPALLPPALVQRRVARVQALLDELGLPLGILNAAV